MFHCVMESVQGQHGILRPQSMLCIARLIRIDVNLVNIGWQQPAHPALPGRVQWWLRRVLGKILSVKRLFKAAFTFNEPLQYLLWKIERHSGHYIEPSPLQLKHPLLFSWPLLWKLYRLGAFR